MQEPAGLAGGAAPAVAQPPLHWSQQQQDPARPQRRTKAGRLVSTITKEELESCFHMPSEQACRHLGVGLTILKRVCRRFGIPRWPYNRQGRPEEGGVADSSGMYTSGGQQALGFGSAAGPGAGPQFAQPFPPSLQGQQPNNHMYAPTAGAAGSQPDWQQQQLQQALSSLFPQQAQQQQQQQQQRPPHQPELAALGAQPAGLPLQGQQDNNQLLQATIAALQTAPPGTLGSPAVQSLLSSLLGGALGGALAAGLGHKARAAPVPPPPPQWGSSVLPSQPAALQAGQQAVPGGSVMQQLAALLQQPAPGRQVQAPAHPQPQPSNPLTATALLSALGAGTAAQAQPAPQPAAGRADSGSLDVLAGAADSKLGGAAAAAGAAPSTGAAPLNPSPVQQDTDGWGESGEDSPGDDDEDLADFLEPGAQLPPRAGAPAAAQPAAAAPPAPAAALPLAAPAAPAVASQAPAQQPPAAAAEPSLAAQLQAQPEKADQLERQLLAALPDLRETAVLLRKAASQLQSHLLAQRLLKERTAQLGAKLPGSCQLLGVNAELAELCCNTLLTLLDGESGATAAALQSAAHKHCNGSSAHTGSGSGGKAPAPRGSSPPERPASALAVKREAEPPCQGSPKRARCGSPAAAQAAPTPS